jgi:hypothetical protein
MRLPRPIKIAFCLVACATLTGCDLKGPWYDPFLIFTPKQEYTGNNRIVSVSPLQTGPVSVTRHLASSKNPRVTLIKLSLPVGTFSGNEKVWRQLDQDALDSQTSILLAENGIRAAVAPQERWAALHKMIDVPGAANEQFTLETDGRSSVTIVTHANITEQTISSIDGDREMHVRSFDRCDNSLRLSLSRRRDVQKLTILLEPVVQLGTISVMRGQEQLGIVGSNSRQEETFANLRLSAGVETNEFLVLAPANPKENNFSVGSRFLTDNDKVPPMETILIFLPVRESHADAGYQTEPKRALAAK